MSTRLYDMCKRKGIAPTRVAEVGVYMPELSNVLGFVRDGIPAELVEADPVCVEQMRAYFAGNDNVRILPYAVWDSNERISLYRANASTFVGGVGQAPAIVNDGYRPREEDRFEVEARRFGDLDPGDIDLLSIDIEGAEWYVLKGLCSRPRVIAIETHAARYSNPHLDDIRRWMEENGYDRWFIDGSDTVYVRRDAVAFGRLELLGNRAAIAFALLRNRMKRWRRSLKAAVRRFADRTVPGNGRAGIHHDE